MKKMKLLANNSISFVRKCKIHFTRIWDIFKTLKYTCHNKPLYSVTHEENVTYEFVINVYNYELQGALIYKVRELFPGFKSNAVCCTPSL